MSVQHNYVANCATVCSKIRVLLQILQRYCFLLRGLLRGLLPPKLLIFITLSISVTMLTINNIYNNKIYNIDKNNVTCDARTCEGFVAGDDGEYLDRLVKRASPNWAGIGDADEWVAGMRGTN